MAARAVSLLIGYIFGNFLTAYVFVRKKKGHSIFEVGSKNPGMQNTLASYGKRMAAVVLAGDVIKTLLAMLLCAWLFPTLSHICEMYALVGVTLGHDYPAWHRFKGGKGVATITAGQIIFAPIPGIISGLVGLLFVLLKCGLDSGALVIAVVFSVIMYFTQSTEIFILSVILTVLMAVRNTVGMKHDPSTQKRITDTIADTLIEDEQKRSENEENE